MRVISLLVVLIAVASAATPDIFLFRFYNPSTDLHWFSSTPSQDVPHGFHFQGAACAGYSKQISGTSALYRFQTTGTSSPVYTNDEKDTAVTGMNKVRVEMYLPTSGKYPVKRGQNAQERLYTILPKELTFGGFTFERNIGYSAMFSTSDVPTPTIQARNQPRLVLGDEAHVSKRAYSVSVSPTSGTPGTVARVTFTVDVAGTSWIGVYTSAYNYITHAYVPATTGTLSFNTASWPAGTHYVWAVDPQNYVRATAYFTVGGSPATTTKAPVTTTRAPATTTAPVTTKAPVTTTKAPVTTTKAPSPAGSFDSRTKWPLAYPGILDQGGCGSCYSFSAATTATWRFNIKKGVSSSSGVSPQSILYCGAGSVYPWGPCDGGWPSAGLDLLTSGGLSDCTHSSMCAGGCHPYAFKSGTGAADTTKCRNKCAAGGVGMLYTAPTKSFTISGTAAVKSELAANGPLVATFTVYQSFMDFFNTNPKGVLTSCTGSVLGGHAVVLIGWGTDPVAGEYWLLQNSWNTWWGDGGFFRVQMGKNLCGLEAGFNGISMNTFKRQENEINGTNVEEESAQRPDLMPGGKIKLDRAFVSNIELFEEASKDYKSNDPNFELNFVQSCHSQITNGFNQIEMVQVGKKGQVVNTIAQKASSNSPTSYNHTSSTSDDDVSAGAAVGIAFGSAAAGFGIGIGACCIGIVVVGLVLFGIKKFRGGKQMYWGGHEHGTPLMESQRL